MSIIYRVLDSENGKEKKNKEGMRRYDSVGKVEECEIFYKESENVSGKVNVDFTATWYENQPVDIREKSTLAVFSSK